MDHVKAGVITIGVLLVVIIGAFMFTENIDNGNVGVEFSMNGGVKNHVLSQGTKWVGLNKVTQYPIKTQTIKQPVALATSDGKKTDVDITYSYHVDATKAAQVYKKFGNVNIESIESGWLNQQLTAAGRTTLAKYTLLEVVGQDSTKVQSGLLSAFQKRVDKQGFILEDLSFGTPKMDYQTKKSIDDIIKAAQDNKKAQLEAKTKLTQANANAQAKITAAKATAKANELKSKSITNTLIQDKLADAHLKHGFVTTNAGSAIVDAK